MDGWSARSCRAPATRHPHRTDRRSRAPGPHRPARRLHHCRAGGRSGGASEGDPSARGINSHRPAADCSRMLTTSPRPVVAFDPLDQAWRFEDRPLYQRLREAGGIAWSPEHGGFWAIVDQELGRQVTADHTSFVSGRGVRIPPSPTFPVFALEYDRPRHVVHRKMLTDAVGPRAVPPLEPMVREHARRLLAARPAGRSTWARTTGSGCRSTSSST